jgi:radical SAM protein with 4Fe4S-binding SPASM domain
MRLRLCRLCLRLRGRREVKVIKNPLQAVIHRKKEAVQMLPKGLHAYHRDLNGGTSHIHLRMDESGEGILIINANRVLHLNDSAALMAYLFLEKTPEKQAVEKLTRAFRVSKTQSQNDYTKFQADFTDLIDPSGPCPIHEMDLEVTLPFSARPSAPYRMDLAITYRCNNDCLHCYNQPQRKRSELTTSEWETVISKLWDIGIPHIVFTGGEPTLRQDLPELIAFAQQKGQVTGLNTNGRRLSDPLYVKQLVDAGLDHVQITLESHDREIHDQMVNAKGAWPQTIAGIKNVLDSPLYVMTNTTLLQQNSPSLSSTLNYLAELGVPTIGLNALIHSGRGRTVGSGLHEWELPQLLEMARDLTDQQEQRLIWYTPTEYCQFDPMQLELGVKGCTAALYNMCIEPDGSVIPCQSFYESLGNILVNSWESIWQHDRAQWLRDRKYAPQKCNDCTLFSECGGGCPLVNLELE